MFWVPKIIKSPRFHGCFKFRLLCPIANLLWSSSYSEVRGWQAKKRKKCSIWATSFFSWYTQQVHHLGIGFYGAWNLFGDWPYYYNQTQYRHAYNSSEVCFARRKLRNCNFQWTRTLWQNNFKHTAPNFTFAFSIPVNFEIYCLGLPLETVFVVIAGN